jgi:predicted O-methyltransferase YrrM
MNFFDSKRKAKIAALEEEGKELRRENKRLREELKARKEPAFVPAGHFYSPIPSAEDIEAVIAAGGVPAEMEGVELDDAGQLELLKRLAPYVKEMPFTAAPDGKYRYGYANTAYSYGDAAPLFCMMRELRPRRVIEIGCGHSSCLMLDTNELFFANGIEFTFIEPYPELLRSLLKPGDLARISIVEKKLQEVELELFEGLEAGDFLFIDSSHVVKAGSDAQRVFSKVLPRLKKGVIVHIHDMFDGFEYPEHWLRQGRAWNELYVMQAFLQYNSAFRIRLFTAYMRRKYRNWFEENMELCLRKPSGNLWIERVE